MNGRPGSLQKDFSSNQPPFIVKVCALLAAAAAMLVTYWVIEAISQLIVVGLVALYDHFMLLPIETHQEEDWPGLLIKAVVYIFFDLQRDSLADLRLDQTVLRFPMAALGGSLSIGLAIVFGRILPQSHALIRTQSFTIIFIAIVIALDNLGPFGFSNVINFALLVGCVAAGPLGFIRGSKVRAN